METSQKFITFGKLWHAHIDPIPIYMKNLCFISLFLVATFACANNPASSFLPPPAAPDFTVTTSDGQVKQLYQDYVSQQKLVVIEAFFTTCPPCATHAPLVQNLYTAMQAAHPGQIEFILLSTLFNDTNAKVAQYKTSKGLTMPGVGKDGGSITALQPYLNGLFGPFQGTPTFIVIAPGSGAVYFDIRGNSPSQTITLLQQKIEELFPTPIPECTLKTPFGAGVEEVQMTVDAPAFDTAFMVINGTYNLSQIASLKNISYKLKPSKTDSPVGLTTYDLVLISKHILAIEPFNCPWQLIAADVNCTGSVTTFDIVTARKVILGLLNDFPCGSWRFVPDSAAVTNGQCLDFVGVKLGDVNAGPCTDSLVAGAESRTKTKQLLFREHDFQPGETAQVPLFFAENMRLEGFQFGFGFDPNYLKINKIEAKTLEGFDDESYRLSNQDLAVSWLQAFGQQILATSPLINLEVTAPQGGRLSELLNFSNVGLTPEAYSSDGQIQKLQLGWLTPVSTYAISPNPAYGHFTLETNAAGDGDFLVQILDVQGKFVFEKTFPATKGLNRWALETPAKTAGLYFLKVNGEAAGKLMVAY